MNIRFDNVVTDAEIESLKSKVWRPKGDVPAVWDAPVDYRTAWALGLAGSKCLLELPEEPVKTPCDLEFDGTAPWNMLKVKFTEPSSSTSRRIRSVLVSIGSESAALKTHTAHFTAEMLFEASFDQRMGEMEIYDWPISHSMDEPRGWNGRWRFTLVKMDFLSGLLHCLWQMKMARAIQSLRAQRLKVVTAKQAYLESELMTHRRSRAALLQARRDSAMPEEVNKEVKEKGQELLFDPQPTRARASSALISPQLLMLGLRSKTGSPANPRLVAKNNEISGSTPPPHAGIRLRRSSA